MLFDLAVPARNEGANIGDALRRLVKALEELDPRDWGITVAVNGTTDDTAARVSDFVASHPILNIRCVECPVPGKGAAIKHAAGLCVADYFGFIDADLSADPEMIVPMLRSAMEGNVVVVGSRLMDTKTTNRGWLRTFSSQVFNCFAGLWLGLDVKDTQCGLKVMGSRAREILVGCEESGWFLDIEFLAKAGQDGLKVLEMPVPWIEYRYATRVSQINMLKDGAEAIRAMLRIRRRIKK